MKTFTWSLAIQWRRVSRKWSFLFVHRLNFVIHMITTQRVASRISLFSNRISICSSCIVFRARDIARLFCPIVHLLGREPVPWDLTTAARSPILLATKTSWFQEPITRSVILPYWVWPSAQSQKCLFLDFLFPRNKQRVFFLTNHNVRFYHVTGQSNVQENAAWLTVNTHKTEGAQADLIWCQKFKHGLWLSNYFY